MTNRPDPGPVVDAAPAMPRRRRPIAVTILAGIQLISAFVFGATAILLAVLPDADLESLGLGVGAGVTVTSALIVLGGYAVIELVAGIALLRLRRIGWTITMLIAGVSMATEIYTWWSAGLLLPLAALANVVTVLYLNQAPVRAAFGIVPRRGGGDGLVESRG